MRVALSLAERVAHYRATVLRAAPTTLRRVIARALQQPLTCIPGPLAGSDIELDRVKGVHGPRTSA